MVSGRLVLEVVSDLFDLGGSMRRVIAAVALAFGAAAAVAPVAQADPGTPCGYYVSPTTKVHYVINCAYQAQKFNVSFAFSGDGERCIQGKQWYTEGPPNVIVGASKPLGSC
jgi:hypothetical protein